jgi:hypothetical protein
MAHPVSGSGEALRTLTPFAAAIATSPVAIGVALLLLLGRQGRQHFWIFLGTWFAGITGATATILHLLPTLSSSGPGGTGSPVLGRVIGVGLLVVAALVGLAAFSAWRGRRSPGRPSLVSRLIAGLDRAPTVLVVVIAAVFAVNPVHLALMAAGVDAIPGTAPAGLVALPLAVAFAAVASIPLLVIAGTVVAAPARTDAMLRGASTWLASRGDAVSAIVLTLAGVWILLQ